MKKLSEKECVDCGGHCWDYKLSYIADPTSSMQMESSIDLRICKHCGKKQKYKPAEWVDK